MCGIVVLAGQVPPHTAAMAIAGAGARGPHTHGWACIDGDGWTVLRYPGRLIYETLPERYAQHLGHVFIGHSRLATSGGRAGDAPPLTESQPYVASGRYLVAHNGTIPWALPGEVDTKLLLRVLEAGAAPFPVLLRTERPQAAVWAVDTSVWACRVDGAKQAAHPLYVARGKNWLAVSSGVIPSGKLMPAGQAVPLI